MRKVRRRFQANQQSRRARPARSSEQQCAQEAQPTPEPQVPVDSALVDTNTGMVTDASVDVHVETTVDLGTGTELDTGLSGYESDVKHIYRGVTVDKGPLSDDKHVYRSATVDKGPLSDDTHVYRKATVDKSPLAGRKD